MVSATLFLLLILVSLASLLPSTTSQSARTWTITNQCSTDYWFHPVSGSAPFASSSITQCNSNADCIAGAYCLLPNTKICFWNLPTTSAGRFRVTAGGGTNTLTFPYVNNGNDVHWSGNIGFCQSGTCGSFAASTTAANCDASPGCEVYAGPGNTFEITMSKQGTDYYDISNIAGVNVPMAIQPVLTSATYSSSNPYTCGAPGATNSPYPSTWQFTVPSVYYNWVTSGGASCTSNSNCASGQICGLTNVPGRSPQMQLQCGTSIGYWSANAVCAQNQNVGSPFDCTLNLPSPNVGATEDQLDRCSGSLGPKSCYQPGAGNDCCGCANWQTIFGSSVVPASTHTCVNDNANWNNYILPKLQWLKQGAPSSYVYPYDDMSSTFTCSQKSGGSYNQINYQITLCPSGGSGGSGGTSGGTIGSGGPYMSTTAPPSQALPTCNAGNTAYYGTGTESVTAHNFPHISPSCGSWTVTVNYNAAASRYIHVDLCTGNWNCFSTAQTGPVAAGTGSVTLTLSDCNVPNDGSGYLYSVWSVSAVDNAASQPYLYKHAWQVYSPVTLGTLTQNSC